MTLYADSSALVKLFADELGSDLVRAAVAADEVTSSIMAYVEVRAALGAALRLGRIPADQREILHQRVDGFWAASLSEIDITNALTRHAGDLAERFFLRGYDALHLASLITVGRPDQVSLICWDQILRRAAAELGYRLLPA